jgi:GTP pyrophosphokinase
VEHQSKLKRQKIEIEQVHHRAAHHHPQRQGRYAALGIIHQTWSPVPGRIKDFLRCRVPTGISRCTCHHQRARHAVRGADPHHRDAPHGGRASPHTEVQEGRIGDHRDDRISSGCASCSYQKEVRDPQEFIQSLKVDLSGGGIMFTPKGLVRRFAGQRRSISRIDSHRRGAPVPERA